MPVPQSPILTTLAARGLLHRCSDLPALDAHCCVGPVRVCASLDLAAEGLHAGHLLPIVALRWFQRTGHKPIVVLRDPARSGAGTTSSDAPAGQARRRAEVILARLLTFGPGVTDAVLIDKTQPLAPADLGSALGEFGSRCRVDRLLSRHGLPSVLHDGRALDLLGLNQLLLEAFDFLELARRWGCLLQLGGSDRWTAILDDIDVARQVEHRQLFGLTTPLSGSGLGLTLGGRPAGSVWLDPDHLDPSAFWACWRGVDDHDVLRLLRLFTDLPLPEIARLGALGAPGIDEAKEVLADEVTRLVHAREALGESPWARVPVEATRAGSRRN